MIIHLVALILIDKLMIFRGREEIIIKIERERRKYKESTLTWNKGWVQVV